jgi:hypothetical protein
MGRFVMPDAADHNEKANSEYRRNAKIAPDVSRAADGS